MASSVSWRSGLVLPELICGHSTGGLHDVVLTSPDGSQARHSPDGDLRQTGPRRLWDEIEVIHRQWQDWGSPRRERFGLSATRDEQWIWLDDPDSGYRWILSVPSR